MEEKKQLNIYQKLMNVQAKLKAPKSQTNPSFKYNYRSAEDILEAVKPLLSENKLILTLSDSVETVGDRYYIKATARLIDTETISLDIVTSAYAREPNQQARMSESQITGSASSYARKYALNGLFCIDDNKDPDSIGDTSKTQQGANKGGYKGKQTNVSPHQNTQQGESMVKTSAQGNTQKTQEIESNTPEFRKLFRDLVAEMKVKGITPARMKWQMQKAFNKDSSNKLTFKELQELKAWCDGQ